MTTHETDILLEEESRRSIERLIDEDPARAALSLRTTRESSAST